MSEEPARYTTDHSPDRPRWTCAWKGCSRTSAAGYSPPHDWRSLLLWHGSNDARTALGEIVRVSEVEATLCPEHARELRRLLRPVE